LSTTARPEEDLHVGEAHRLVFEEAARECYELARIPWHGNVVWVSSPLALAITAPAAALLLTLRRCGHGGQHDCELMEAARALPMQAGVGAAVASGLREAVRQAPQACAAVCGQDCEPTAAVLARPVELALSGALSSRLRSGAGLAASAKGSPVLRAMRLAVHADVVGALERAPAPATPEQMALRRVIWQTWYKYISGLHRFAFGWLFDEVWGAGDSGERQNAYVRAAAAACCWYPHREILVACEWPSELRPELLESEGQVMLWSDRWGVYMQGGRRVPQWAIEAPQLLTVAAIQRARNRELRRMLIERYGWQRYLRDSGAETADRRPAAPPAPAPKPPAVQPPVPPEPQAAAG
jgi:hypothetical protein